MEPPRFGFVLFPLHPTCQVVHLIACKLSLVKWERGFFPSDLQTQTGFWEDHWLLFWQVIVFCPFSSNAGWHSNVNESPWRNVDPSLLPYASIPGSPQLPWSISRRNTNKDAKVGNIKEIFACNFLIWHFTLAIIGIFSTMVQKNTCTFAFIMLWENIQCPGRRSQL